MENTRYRHPPLQGKIYKSAIVWLQALLLALAGTCALVLAPSSVEVVADGQFHIARVTVSVIVKGQTIVLDKPLALFCVENVV